LLVRLAKKRLPSSAFGTFSGKRENGDAWLSGSDVSCFSPRPRAGEGQGDGDPAPTPRTER
jgi:hypothetical protein